VHFEPFDKHTQEKARVPRRRGCAHDDGERTVQGALPRLALRGAAESSCGRSARAALGAFPRRSNKPSFAELASGMAHAQSSPRVMNGGV
jgi:hypothetical protein